MTTTPWRRILGLFIPVVALAAILAVPATAGGGGHPYFNDQGTLSWYHSLPDAQRAAERQDKLIFIEYGRRACTNCRILCNRVLPHARIRGRMAAVAVGLVGECDRPEPRVYWLFKRNLPNARMLPFAGFITADGRWVTGFAGRANASQFATHLAVAERVLQKQRTRRTKPDRHINPSRRSEPARKTAPRPARRATPEAKPQPVVPQPVVSQPEPAPIPAPAAETHTSPPGNGGIGDGIGCPDGGCDDADCCPPTDCPNGQCAAPDCCPGGNCCPGGDCTADGCPPGCQPNGLYIPGIGRLPLPGCSPCCPPKQKAPVAVQQRDDSCGFPPPAPRRSQEGRSLAAATPVPPMIDDIGSPDGDGTCVAPIEPGLPQPVVRRAGAVPPLATPVAKSGVAPLGVRAAAAKGDWGTVVRGTRRTNDEQLVKLNREAHAWAHGQLAAAVRALREGRFTDAERSVSAVTDAMRGEPESVDAERGAEAIELMRDMTHLSAASPVRKAVRKNAYEKMRGTRWAPLFNECASPSPALSVR